MKKPKGRISILCKALGKDVSDRKRFTHVFDLFTFFHNCCILLLWCDCTFYRTNDIVYFGLNSTRIHIVQLKFADVIATFIKT